MIHPSRSENIFIMTIQCEWEECGKQMRDVTNLRNHLFAKHWPWSVREFVCEYCRRGYHTLTDMLSHTRSESHLTAMEKDKPYYAKAQALEWIEKRRNENKLSDEQYRWLTQYEQKTQNDIDDNILTPYTPTHPQMGEGETDGPSNSNSTSMSDINSGSTKTDALKTIGQSTKPSNRVKPKSCSKPSTSTDPTTTNYIIQKEKCFKGTPKKQPVSQLLSRPSSSSDDNTHQTPAVPTPKPVPSSPLEVTGQSHMLTNPTTTKTKLKIQKKKPTPLAIPAQPSRLTDDCVEGPVVKRRRLQDQLDETEDIQEMFHLIAKAMDEQAARIESLESSILSKTKEFSYAQSNHLAKVFQTIVETEAFQTKKYFRKLLLALQKDVVNSGQE